MSCVFIRGLEVTACHGVHDSEKVIPQKFVFDADIETDFYGAAKGDSLSGTVNYSAMCDVIARTATEKSYDLIETLAYACAAAVLEDRNARGLKLTVYKPQAPVKHKFATVGVTLELKKERVILSMGSSIGDKKGYLDSGLKLLEGTPGIRVVKVSSYIETEPYGGVAENKFINCAAEIETWLPPEKLLEEIHRIEAECGRERTVHWGDRTLDVDIVFYGKRVICEDDLQVPHPEYSARDFVMKPLNEIIPDFICPVFKKKIRDIRF